MYYTRVTIINAHSRPCSAESGFSDGYPPAFLSDSMVSHSPLPASNSRIKNTASWISTKSNLKRLKELKQKQSCPVSCAVVINSNGERREKMVGGHVKVEPISQ